MAVNQKPTGRAVSMPTGLAIGGVCSLGLTVCMAAGMAWLVAGEKLAEKNIGYGIMVLLLISSFAGAMLSFHRVKRQRMLVCILSGGIYFSLLLAVTALFFGGQYSAVGVTAILIFCGSLLAAMAGLRQGRRAKHPKIKMPHR